MPHSKNCMDDTDTQSHFLLDLYRAVHEQGAEQFQDWALERLSRDLPFDSALWASASATEAGPVGHLAHLYRQPAHMIADYEALKHMDTLNAASLKQPGKTLFVVTRDALPEAVHPCVERYGLEQAMSTLAFEPQIAVYSVISLYRADRERPFIAAEAQFKQTLFPHLVEADSRNKLMQLEGHAPHPAASPLALCGRRCTRPGSPCERRLQGPGAEQMAPLARAAVARTAAAVAGRWRWRSAAPAAPHHRAPVPTMLPICVPALCKSAAMEANCVAAASSHGKHGTRSRQ